MSTFVSFAPVEGRFNFGSMSMLPPPMVECSLCGGVIIEGKEQVHVNFHADQARPAHVGTIDAATLAELDVHDRQARDVVEQ